MRRDEEEIKKGDGENLSSNGIFVKVHFNFPQR